MNDKDSKPISCDLCGKYETSTDPFEFEGFRMRCRDRASCEARCKLLLSDSQVSELKKLQKEKEELQARVEKVIDSTVQGALDSGDPDRMNGVWQQLRCAPDVASFDSFRLRYAQEKLKDA